MTQFKICYGIGGGYNVKTTETIEADSLDSAEQIAYEAACEMFESYNVFGRQYPDFDYGSISDEDCQQVYYEELERWISYTAKVVE